MLHSIRRFVMRALPPVKDPRSYWEQRHRRHAGRCTGVGHHRLSDEQNRRDYDTKASQLRRALAPIGSGANRRTLLDAGCGVGAFFPLYADLGFDIHGVDFSETAVREASAFRGANVTVGDIATAAPPGPFDAVVSIDVLFHVLSDEAWRGFLGAARERMAPDGRLVVQESLVDPSEYSGVTRHCHFRRASDYEQAATSVGLELETSWRYELPEEKWHKDVLIYRRAT